MPQNHLPAAAIGIGVIGGVGGVRLSGAVKLKVAFKDIPVIFCLDWILLYEQHVCVQTLLIAILVAVLSPLVSGVRVDQVYRNTLSLRAHRQTQTDRQAGRQAGTGAYVRQGNQKPATS